MSAKGESSTNGKNAGWSGAGIAVGVLVVFLILLLLFGTCTESGKAYFANVKSKIGGGGNLKDLDIVMFMSPTCPWCKKMIDVIQKAGQLNNITVVDMSKPEGQAMAKQFGADKQPVPSFISRKTKTGTVGYRESVDKLIEALKPGAGGPPPGAGGPQGQGPQGGGPQQGGSSAEEGGGIQVDVNLVQQLQVILFAREGCGWCSKAKDMLSQSGVMDVIRIVDITTPEGQSMAGELLPPGSTGVPAWVSLATKKAVVGFKPIDVLIQELQ